VYGAHLCNRQQPSRAIFTLSLHDALPIFERLSEDPLEIWDGAHNLAGLGYLLPRLPTARYVVVASILADKDVDGMLAALSVLGELLVATSSSNERALSAADLALRAEPFFARVE